MKSISELRDMTLDQLQDELLVLRKDQFELRVKKVNQALDTPHHINQVRKVIAKIKTIMTEKAGNKS